MNEELGTEIVRKLIVRGDDNGREVVVTPDGIRMESPGGWVVIEFDAADHSPRLTLASHDGRALARLRAGDDGTGFAISACGKQASFVPGGLLVDGGECRATLTQEGIACKQPDGEVSFTLPFLAGAKNAVGDAANSVKRWLAEVLKV